MSRKELEYQKIGDFYLPKVTLPAEDDKLDNIGKYGLLRLEYLKEHKKGYYTFLMINGSVPFELRNIDSAANERVKKIIKQLADEENVNEELKAKDQMEWVRCMNNIKNRAEEIVLKELIYV
ncbi:MAG: TnpV protein [Clostridia bacterium]|jgi:maltooligosyltrehalose synthase